MTTLIILLIAILGVLTQILRLLRLVVINTRREARSIIIYQEKDGNMSNGQVLGIVPGKTGVFRFVPNPAGSSITPPLVVVTNDPLAVPDSPVLQSDGSYTCNVVVDHVSKVGGSFTLSASFKRTTDGNQAAGLMIVPYNAPALNEAQSIDIAQVS